MQFHFFDAVVFTGVVNAFVFSGVIFFKLNRSAADTVLSAVLLILGLLCIKILLHTLGLWQTAAFAYFPLGFDLWPAPLLWFYVLALTEKKKLSTSLISKHLALPLLFLVYAVGVYVFTQTEPAAEAKRILAEKCGYSDVKFAEDLLSVCMGIFYGIAGYRQLRKYQHWVESYISNTSVPLYQWLRNLFVVTVVIIVLLGIMILYQQRMEASFAPVFFFYLYLAAFIYILGFFGFRHQDFQLSQEMIDKKTMQATDPGLTALLDQLQQWMSSEKPYLESELNLGHCAEKMGCSVAALSEVINQQCNMNFREFINQYRVEEFKSRILQADLRKETIMGVAYACGFNSEASFYRIFKEKTGMTPKSFLHNPG